MAVNVSKELTVEIKKLLRSLGLLVLFLVVVFGVNLLVDPANLASDRYAQQAAEIMASCCTGRAKGAQVIIAPKRRVRERPSIWR